MENYSVEVNSNQIPNLIFKHHRKNRMNMSVLIKKPAQELEKLKSIDRLDSKENNISKSDLSKENSDKASELIDQLQGVSLYANDKCPMMGKKNMNFDLSGIFKALKKSESTLGKSKFETTRILISENFLGSKTMEGHPPHHVLNDGYVLMPENPYYPPANVEMPPPLPARNKEGDQTINLQANSDDNSELLLTEEIENPEIELKILTQIAALDGEPQMISEADLEKAKKKGLLEKLEGYELYTNDSGKDATLRDLNMAAGIFSYAKNKIDLTKTKAICEEKLIEKNQRHTIRGCHFLMNEITGHYFPIQILERDKK
jgi:hypothetical protein